LLHFNPYLAPMQLRNLLCGGNIVPAGGAHESQSGFAVYQSNPSEINLTVDTAMLAQIRSNICKQWPNRPQLQPGQLAAIAPVPPISVFDGLVSGMVDASANQKWKSCLAEKGRGLQALLWKQQSTVMYWTYYVNKSLGDTEFITFGDAPKPTGMNCRSSQVPASGQGMMGSDQPLSVFAGDSVETAGFWGSCPRDMDQPVQWTVNTNKGSVTVELPKPATSYTADALARGLDNLILSALQTVDVQANQRATTQGIYLMPGETATITVSGTWDVWGDPNRSSSAEGDLGAVANNPRNHNINPSWVARNLGWFPEHADDWPVSGGYEGALIVWLDDKFVHEFGPGDRIGVNTFRTTITGPGVIKFGPNDNKLDDNSGSLRVETGVNGPIYYAPPPAPNTPVQNVQSCSVPRREHLGCASAGIFDTTDPGCSVRCINGRQPFCQDPTCYL
jgi:hypothetical protein